MTKKNSHKPQPQTAKNPKGKSAHQEALELADKSKQEEIKKTLKIEDKEEEPGEINILKAKITRMDTLEVEYTRDGDTFTVKKKGKIHDDLKAAFDKLIPHAAILTDLKEVKKMSEIFDDCTIIGMQNLRVSAFHLSGDMSHNVVLTLIKQINNNKQIIINSPITEMDSENEPYPFSGYLAKAIDVCKEEVEEYLDGKCAVDPQGEIEFENETELVEL